MSRITFHGGAGSVTGVNILVETGDLRFLVDCGLEQREHVAHEANHAPFSYDTKAVSALFITHAHLDHIGRVPKLVHEGFTGTIFSTPATRDLAALMFEDALGIMQNDPGEALYVRADVERTLSLWQTHEYRKPFTLGSDITVTFLDAGHILGSAMILSERNGKKILFTGDLGNSPEPLLHDTESPKGANYIVMESVYGDRLHEDRATRRERLKEVVEKVRTEGGVLLIPSFSIERTQVILYELNAMLEGGEILPIPVYLDSPLSIRITEVYKKYHSLMNEAVQARYEKGDDPFEFKGLKLTPMRAESEAIDRAPKPKVIIAGAGMSHGGRIREHEKTYLPDRHATVLFVGYQAPGSLGRRILDGEKRVEIDGQSVRVKAATESIFGYSGHADRDQLVAFAQQTADTVKKAFVIMGEPKSSQFLAQRLHDFLGLDAIAPTGGESFEIEW